MLKLERLILKNPREDGMSKLNRLLTLSFLLSTTLMATVSQAKEQTLATIDNDLNTKTFRLVLDSNEETGAIKAFYKDTFLNGIKASRIVLNLETISNNGMILEQKEKYVVMKLKSDNFDKYQGGIINIDTLYNGASGSRKSYEVALAKDKSGWILNKKGRIIKKFFINSNVSMIFGVVGIKSLDMK
jgi:outer membrane murein-binding lipoprotein Lpp